MYVSLLNMMIIWCWACKYNHVYNDKKLLSSSYKLFFSTIHYRECCICIILKIAQYIQWVFYNCEALPGMVNRPKDPMRATIPLNYFIHTHTHTHTKYQTLKLYQYRNIYKQNRKRFFLPLNIIPFLK